MAERLEITMSTIPTRRGDVAHLVLKGVLDAQTVESFEAILDESMRSAPMVVIDLKGLTWISSAGAGALLVAAKRAEQRGGALVLAQPGRQVKEVLAALGLEVLLAIGGTLEEAVGQLKTATHIKPRLR